MNTVHLQVPTSKGIFVDESMRPILENLWRLGFETLYSCEGQSKSRHVEEMQSYIAFKNNSYSASLKSSLERHERVKDLKATRCPNGTVYVKSFKKAFVFEDWSSINPGIVVVRFNAKLLEIFSRAVEDLANSTASRW